MAKFQVFESVLNEYVDHPRKVLVQEVEATNAQEAMEIVKMLHPTKESLTILRVES